MSEATFREFRAGVLALAPLLIGVIPFGMIYGALALSQGLSPAAALAMSSILFAGSAQFLFCQLVGVGAPATVTVAEISLLNLRHALYSATVQPVTRSWPWPWRVLGAFWLTDEAFAVFEQRMQTEGERDSLPYYLGSVLSFYLNWVGWTAVGAYLGNRIPGVATLGLDFAMIATFAAMIAPQLKALTPLAVAATAGSVAWAAQGLPYKFGLMLAALAGVGVGVLLDYRQRRLAAGGNA